MRRVSCVATSPRESGFSDACAVNTLQLYAMPRMGRSYLARKSLESYLCGLVSTALGDARYASESWIHSWYTDRK
jgi:hypothetical protein